MYYVYILRSLKDAKLYFGYARDLRARFAQHNSGKCRSTKARVPFEMHYYEAYKVQKDAIERERQLKRDGKALGQLKRRLKHSLLAPSASGSVEKSQS